MSPAHLGTPSSFNTSRASLQETLDFLLIQWAPWGHGPHLTYLRIPSIWLGVWHLDSAPQIRDELKLSWSKRSSMYLRILNTLPFLIFTAWKVRFMSLSWSYDWVEFSRHFLLYLIFFVSLGLFCLLHKSSMRMWWDSVLFYRGEKLKMQPEMFQRHSGNSARNELSSFSALDPRVNRDFVNIK